jgi:hypothetical protein
MGPAGDGLRDNGGRLFEGKLMKVWLAVLPAVVSDVSPKLLVKANVPFPPTVFFTTVIAPSCVLVKVQVVVAPDTTVMPEDDPLLQKTLLCQPVGTVSLML